MPKYVIEREIPGAGKLSAGQLKAISQTSCGVLSKMGPQIQWVHSYVTGDKIYCVYIAPNEELVREHAKAGADLPANRFVERSGRLLLTQLQPNKKPRQPAFMHVSGAGG